MSGSVRKSSAKKGSPTVDADDIKKVGDEILVSYKILEEAWKKAEEKLSFAHVPEDVKVKVEDSYLGTDEQPFGERVTSLGYGRIKGQWKICLVVEDDFWDRPDMDSKGTWTPISEASVYWRMEMIHHFQALCAEVVAVTRRFVDEIKKKAAEFEADLNLLDL